MIRRSLLPTLLAGMLLAACSDAPTAPATTLPPRHVDLAEPWRTASAAAVGFDVPALQNALDRARDLEFLRALVIVRNGYLIEEQYYRGHTAESLADVRSVTKSIVSTLVGIGMRDGVLHGVDQSISELLPESLATLSLEKGAVTLRHLLTMTSGFEWHESGGIGYEDWLVATDHIRYLTDRRLEHAPGTVFNYNSAAVHLLSVLLTEASGLPTPEFARLHLFGPLGIDRVAWEPLADGYVNGGAGIDLRARDLARLGQLFLQNGASGVRQVVPSEWTVQATTPRFSGFGTSAPIRSMNYGYLWWIEEASPPAFFAWGYGGQFIYVVPSLQLVVVTTSHWRGVSDAATQARRALELIVDQIVPSAT